MKLTEALGLFNRKERYWLIRNVLGQGAERLDADFCERLRNAIGVAVPEDAWWAMDYHLDWLIGALHLVDHGPDGAGAQINADRLVKGNQEDIDLIVAFDETLILLEAKGATSWGKAQIDSKIDRLSAVLERQASTCGFVPRVFLVLTSPVESQSLERPGNKAWPRWMVNGEGQLYWIPLDMALDGKPVTDGKVEFRTIERCSGATGDADRNGAYWRVARSRISVYRQ